MFDLGWTELLLIGIVALIVIGPKDLPGMFRTVGRLMGKAKGMAREFSRAMNDAADQSGVNEIQKTFKAASNPMKSAMAEVKKTTDTLTRDLDAATRPELSEAQQAQAEKIGEKVDEMAKARKAAATESATQPATSAGPDAARAKPGAKAKAKVRAKDQA